jgi:hypothetical protein
VLKKAGIIVAASAAGLLALSPLAFANEGGHDNGGGRGHSDNRGDKEQGHGDRIDFEDNSYSCYAPDVNAPDQSDSEGYVGGTVAPPGLPPLLGIAAPINIPVNAFNQDCSPGARSAGLLNFFGED